LWAITGSGTGTAIGAGIMASHRIALYLLFASSIEHRSILSFDSPSTHITTIVTPNLNEFPLGTPDIEFEFEIEKATLLDLAPCNAAAAALPRLGDLPY
jgi:hypothetical protein